MIFCGFDTDQTGDAVCFLKDYKDANVAAAILLIGYGMPSNNALLCPNSKERLLDMSTRLLKGAIDEIAESADREDLNFVRLKLADVFNTLHIQTRSIREYLGVGLYLGGSILLSVNDRICALSFGGCNMYRLHNDTLQLLTGETGSIITDAIGATKTWNPHFVLDSVHSGEHLLLTSGRFVDTKNIESSIHKIGNYSSTPKMLSMILRRQLEVQDEPPCAVIDLLEE